MGKRERAKKVFDAAAKKTATKVDDLMNETEKEREEQAQGQEREREREDYRKRGQEC